MCLVASIKAQNTFTTSALKADSAQIIYTKTDSLRSGIVRTDSLCSAKDLCVQQNAKITGDVLVQGKVQARAGINFDTTGFGLKNAVMTTTAGSISFLYAGALPTAPASGDIPPIDIDECNEAGINPSIPPSNSIAGGFIATSIGSGRNSGLAMYAAPWGVGDGFIECNGTSQALLVNYFCGKDILLGTGSGNPTTGHKSKIYTGEFVHMSKHLEIGDPAFGTNDTSNINLESTANAGKANIRAKTYSINTPQLSVFNTNNGSSNPLYAYNNRNTFVVYGDGRTVIRSLENYLPLLSIGQFTSSTDVGVEMFKVYSNGKTIIGNKKIVGSHSNAILQVAGKIGCMELVVLDPVTKWADYVFSTDYNLLDISKLKEYIMNYKHLPDVPNEEEIKKEGIDVAKIFSILLQKIEENTLYIISLNERIKLLEQENYELKKRQKQ